MIAALFFAAMQVAQANSTSTLVWNGPDFFCPNSSATWSASASKNGVGTQGLFTWTLVDSGISEFVQNNVSTSNFTITTPFQTGVYTLRLRYISYADVSNALILAYFANIDVSVALEYYTKTLQKRVEIRHPNPGIPRIDGTRPLIWCNASQEFTVCIPGITNNAANCNYNQPYEYLAPSGWEFDKIGNDQYFGTNKEALRSTRTCVKLKSPSSVTNGSYDLAVRTYNFSPTVSNTYKIWMGPPIQSGWLNITQGSGNGRGPFNLCTNRTYTVVYYENPSNQNYGIKFDYDWTLPNGATVRKQINTAYGSSIEFQTGVGFTVGNITCKAKNQCGGSYQGISEKATVNLCNVSILPMPINPPWTGITPFLPDKMDVLFMDYKPHLLSDTVSGYLNLRLMPSFGGSDSEFLDFTNDVGFTYYMKVSTKSGVAVLSDSSNMQQVDLDVSTLTPGNYLFYIYRSDNEIFRDTLFIPTTCSGTCFIGLSPATNQPAVMYPIIYPNPGSTDLSLAFLLSPQDPTTSASPTFDVGFSYNIAIFDLNGNQIITGSSNYQTYSMSIASMQQGIYIVRVTDGTNLQSFYFVKN